MILALSEKCNDLEEVKKRTKGFEEHQTHKYIHWCWWWVQYWCKAEGWPASNWPWGEEITLSEVHYMPMLDQKLLSTKKLQGNGNPVPFWSDGTALIVQDKTNVESEFPRTTQKQWNLTAKMGTPYGSLERSNSSHKYMISRPSIHMERMEGNLRVLHISGSI